jgi:hypothetical protein
MPPARKLVQARYTSTTRIEPLQIISNVLIRSIYNETAKEIMGILPSWYARESKTIASAIMLMLVL